MIDRKGGIHTTKLATIAEELAFIRVYEVGDQAFSTLWRYRAGGEPEPVAMVNARIDDIYLTERATLLVSEVTANGRRELFLLGSVPSLTTDPEIERLGGTLLTPLSASPPDVQAFDGSSVYYTEQVGDVTEPWQLVSLSLENAQTTVLAHSLSKAPENDRRTPRSLFLRGDDLIWLEADEGFHSCTRCDGLPEPHQWTERQMIRSVPRRGGDVQTIWAHEPRVARLLGISEIVPVGCSMALVDGRPSVTMMIP